jgi:hypothetical protein
MITKEEHTFIENCYNVRLSVDSFKQAFMREFNYHNLFAYELYGFKKALDKL